MLSTFVFDYHAGDNFLVVEAIDAGMKDYDFTLIEDNAFSGMNSYSQNENNNGELDNYFFNKGNRTPTDDPGTIAP